MKRMICAQCRRPTVTCYCHTIRKIANKWPVTIVQHPNEAGHALGTARIAALSLSRCELVASTSFDAEARLRDPLCEDQWVLIYPGEDAADITTLDCTQPKRLLFLDGTWRKTRRMLYESTLLQGLPRACLPVTALPTRYRLRKSPRAGYLSTVEAICCVLGVLEQDREKYQPLLKTQEWMQQQQIQAMGKAVYARNYTRNPARNHR